MLKECKSCAFAFFLVPILCVRRNHVPAINDQLKQMRDLMKIYDDIFSWDGWGGLLKLASGKCRLKMFDLKKGKAESIDYLKPIIVIITDVPESKMSIKSCSSHIATKLTEKFNIDPTRMLFIEYYPPVTYGDKGQYHIAEKYEVVEFQWHEGRAISPKWRPLKPPMLNVVKDLLKPGQRSVQK